MNDPTSMCQLQRLLLAQQAEFKRQVPDYRKRMWALAELRRVLRQRQNELVRAVSEDFGGRSPEETLALELFPLYEQIRHVRSHLKRWMRQKRVRSSWYLMPSRAFVQYQPLGVVGVMGAWNYQILLSLGPVVEAIAAGNHVMIKPSEVTPRSAELILQIIAETFAPEYVTCVTGDTKVSERFSSLPFDHLFFTGSTRVGKIIMRAAAENLTPVTLELGGKSPAILHESYPLSRAVPRLMTGKLYNAGQTCVAPDYLLIREGQEAALEDQVRRDVAKLYPRFIDNPDYTRIVSRDHYLRLQSYADDARAKGGRVVVLASDQERGTLENKVFPPTLIFSATDEMLVMQEEIFGPLLPVLTYKTIEDAIAYVNDHPKPLALYYFDQNSSRVKHLLDHTFSGGVTVNDCVFHLGQQRLPFGGVGSSGMGQYHGHDGFVTFSKQRGVMVQRSVASTSLFRAPFDRSKKTMIHLLLRLAMR